MKRILLICFIVVGYISNSQVPYELPTIYGGKIYKYKQYLAIDSGLFSPRRDTNFIPKQGGCLVFKTSDSTLYVSTGLFVGRKWKGIGSGGGSGVYNAGNGLTLSSGTFKLDTTIGATKNYALNLYNLLNGTKKNKSDSALNSASYLTRGKGQNLIDSLAGLVQKTITAGWGWTLTSNVGKTDSSVVASKAYALYLYNLLLNNSTFYKANGTLSGNRDVEIGSNYLSFNYLTETVLGISKDGTLIYTTDGSDNMIARVSVVGAVDTAAITVNQSHITLENGVVNVNNGEAYSVLTRGTTSKKLTYVPSTTFRPTNYGVATVTDANYVLSVTDDMIFLNDATATRVLTLPTASTNTGRQIIINFKGTTEKWTVTNVKNGAGASIPFIPYNQAWTLVSDGASWIIIHLTDSLP